MTLKEKIEQSVKTSYQKYGLKDSTRQEFISMIEAEAARQELTPENEDSFIQTQVTAYEFAAKLAQKEAMERTPKSIPVPTPASELAPPAPAFDPALFAQLMAAEVAKAVAPLQTEISALKTTKTKEDVFATVRQKLKDEARTGYKDEKAERAWRFATKGLDETNLNVDALYIEYKTLYDEECSIAGIVGYKPADSSSGNEDSVDLSATKAYYANKGALPATPVAK